MFKIFKLAYYKGLFIRIPVEEVGQQTIANAVFIVILNVIFLFCICATIGGVSTWEALKPITVRELDPLPTATEYLTNPRIDCYNGVSVPLDFLVNCTVLTKNFTTVFTSVINDDAFVSILGDSVNDMCTEYSFPDSRLIRMEEAQAALVSDLQRLILALTRNDKVLFFRLQQIVALTQQTNGYNNQNITAISLFNGINTARIQVAGWYTNVFKVIGRTVENTLRSKYPEYVVKFKATNCRAPMAESWFTRFSFVITTCFTIISFIRFVMNKIFVLCIRMERVQYANAGAPSSIIEK